MTERDPRAAYWNESYREYWRKRVAEAGAGESEVLVGDARTEEDSVYEEVLDTHPMRVGSVLDVGCAWGRMFPIFLDRGLRVSGVDISDAMIEAAMEAFSDVEGVEALRVATAENLPFDSGTFDNLASFAVFDATFQHQALAEFVRVLRPGGRLYFTGKADRYPMDDDLALEAEKGARQKGHPNYFTDVDQMVGALEEHGCRIVGEYYFERRGDFSEWRYRTDREGPLYEWFLVVDVTPGGAELQFPPFSDAFSETYRQRIGEDPDD